MKRTGKRQATPFARRKLVERPKRPGRKTGQGKFSRREQPAPKRADETKRARLHGCPQCGSRLRDIHKPKQYVADIPKVQPIITLYVIYSGYCGDSHKRVRSRHPEQTSQVTGAAGVMVGPRAQALETQLDALISKQRKLKDPDNVRFTRRLRKHRPHLLRFLYVDGLDDTNNLAER